MRPKALRRIVPLLAAIRVAAERNKVDSARLGGSHTTLELRRADSGPNYVSIGLGTPPQMMNLTATTSEWYLAVAGDCRQCLDGYDGFNASASSTYTETTEHLVYEFNFPAAPDDTLEVDAVYARENVTLANNETVSLPLTHLNAVREGLVRRSLCPGTHGFFGLAVDPSQPAKSLVAAARALTTDDSFTFGFDIRPWDRAPPDQTGEIHWGGVPDSAYVGDFHWIEAESGAGWSTAIDHMRINGMQINLEGYHATFDPSFDEIYVPRDVAERIFKNINLQTRIGNENRWFLGCNSNISMTVTISGVEYAVDPGALVTSRWSRGVCSANIVAWQDASHPGGEKEIRLGASFLAGVYAAFHYANDTQYVGLAGKPGSVNDKNMAPKPSKNKVAVAAALGTLIPLLFILLAVCYVCNRRSIQSKIDRRYRRAEREEYNRSVRASSAGSVREKEKDVEGATVPILDKKASTKSQSGKPTAGHGHYTRAATYDRDAPLPPTPRTTQYVLPLPAPAPAPGPGPGPTPAELPLPTPLSPPIIPMSPVIHNNYRKNRKLRDLFGPPYRRPADMPHPGVVDPEGWKQLENEALAEAEAHEKSRDAPQDVLGLYDSASQAPVPDAYSLEEFRRHRDHSAKVPGCAFCQTPAGPIGSYNREGYAQPAWGGPGLDRGNSVRVKDFGAAVTVQTRAEKEKKLDDLARAYTASKNEEYLAYRDAEHGKSERLERAKLERALEERARREKEKARKVDGKGIEDWDREKQREKERERREKERLERDMAALERERERLQAEAAEKERTRRKKREQKEQERAQEYTDARAAEEEKYRDIRENDRVARARARGASIDLERERAKNAVWEREQERHRVYLFERERQREKDLVARLERERLLEQKRAVDEAGGDVDTTDTEAREKCWKEQERRERAARKGGDPLAGQRPRDTRPYDVRSAFDPKWTPKK